MKKKILNYTLILAIVSLFTIVGYGQKTDTVIVDASKVNTKFLTPGTHRYLVYFKMGKDSSRTKYQLWSRTINFISYQDHDAISITQEWEDNNSIVHTAYSVVKGNDFTTLYHKTWWKRPVSFTFDFVKKQASLDDVSLSIKTDSVNINRLSAFEKASSQYFLNWHLDLEVFSLLPYKTGAIFKINFYDPGFRPPSSELYSVIGSDTLTGYNNEQIDCWLLQHGSLPENQEVYWISKKTREVLKLEQEFSGKFRYKIKLGFSD